MKNLRLLLFFLTMSASLCGWCYDFEKGGIYYNILSEQDKTVEVAGSNYEYTEFSIPAEVNGYAVISIGEQAFAYKKNLTSVVIPNEVTTIKKSAFLRSGLQSIYISSNVINIGSNAFKDCNNLASIVVDKENNVYDSRNNCNALIDTAKDSLITGCNTTVIPDGVKIIGSEAFYGCKNLASVVIPNGVKIIGSEAFCGCKNLASVVIPNGVTTIERSAFQKSGLQSIYISKSVTDINEDAFGDCYQITSFVVDKDNKVYDSRNNCNALIYTAKDSLIIGFQNTIIPNDIKTIGKRAFSYCDGLTSLIIPNSVTTIGDKAFYGSGLQSIYISNSVINIGKNAFDSCTSLYSIKVEEDHPIYDSRDNCNAIIETATNSLIKGCNGTKIPDGITTICKNAFSCDLISINIPSTVTSIETGAFRKVIDVYVYYETPIQLVHGTFSSYNRLHVPKGTRNLYAQAINWRLFTIIDDIVLNNTSINSVAYEDNINSNVYTLDGRLTDNTQKAGIYIKNGKKVIIR